MRLKYQLFVTLLIASALLVAVMFLVSSLSFSRGFLGYINNSDSERLYSLALELEQRYANDGNWDNTTSDPRVMRSLLRSSGVHHRQKEKSGGKNSRHDKPPPPPVDRFLRRIVLANADKQLLVGRIDNDTPLKWQPLNHQEEIVGYVGIHRLKRLDNQFDRAFEQQQRKSFALAGLLMVLLSAVLAAPLASRIVKPILGVKKTVAEISNGNYAHRIEISRSDEIGDLSTDINKLGASLEKNRDSRQRHFAEISHELRTPVAVLQAELEALQDGVRDLDPEAVNSLHAETVKLNRLIEDLRTLSLADAGALEYQMQAINLPDFIQSRLDKRIPDDSEIKVTLNTQGRATYINADKQRLEQLFDNLLQNSERYTTKPGSLTVSVTVQNKSVTVQWADSEPGVPTEALNKLFDPLYRVESSRNSELGGSGLGLSIVQKIVDAHGGTCSAAHSSTGGLEITIIFPKPAFPKLDTSV